MHQSLHCYVYKNIRKEEIFLFVVREYDFSQVPEQLLETLGEMKKVIDLQLTPEQKLARSDTQLVITNLLEQGYYLQLPPSKKHADI